MLTARQHDLFAFLRDYQREHDGVSPTFEEMAKGLQLKGKSGIHAMLEKLEERGLIRRLRHSARAIEILKPTSLTSETLTERLIAQLYAEHGMDDGEGMVIIASPEEIRASFRKIAW